MGSVVLVALELPNESWLMIRISLLDHNLPNRFQPLLKKPKQKENWWKLRVFMYFRLRCSPLCTGSGGAISALGHSPSFQHLEEWLLAHGSRPSSSFWAWTQRALLEGSTLEAESKFFQQILGPQVVVGTIPLMLQWDPSAVVVLGTQTPSLTGHLEH